MRRSSRVTFAAAIGLGLLLSAQPPAHAQQSEDELEQLVAPIALYPDELVAEILAAATYPSDLDEAAQWLQQSAGASPDQIAAAVDQTDWDPSVKAITEFPDVLAMMAQNLAWTSALGDAYANQPDDVLDAIQALRQRALTAGTLQSNSQIKVTIENGLISIEPADSSVVYVPSYDCWSVYGAGIAPYPQFVLAAGIVRGPQIRWGVGIRLGGEWGKVSWGWHNWSSDWKDHRVAYQRKTYVTHSPSVVDHHFAPRAGAEARPSPAARQPEPAGRAPVGKAVPKPGPSVIGTPRAAPPAGATERPAPIAKAPAGKAVPAPEPARPSPSNAAHPAPPAPRATVQPEPTRAAAPKPVPTPTPPAATSRAAVRGFPQANPKPTSPPSGTKSSAFGGFNHGSVAAQNASRGQASMNSHPAPPPKPASPPKPAAPKRGGRGGRP